MSERVEAIRRRIECASCHKAPTDDPGLSLKRKNVKGVPGVFLCQFCDGADAALAQAEREREEQGRYACEMVDEVNRAQKEERAARAEVERLTGERDREHDYYTSAAAEREKFVALYDQATRDLGEARRASERLRDERDAARAEVERLKAQLNANCLQRDALQIRTRALEAALGKLLGELSDVQIEAVREGCGNTNAACLRQRVDNARAALTEPTKEAGS